MSADNPAPSDQTDVVEVVAPVTVEAAIEEAAIPDAPGPATHAHDRPLLGIACKVASVITLTIMAGGVKWLGAFPTGQIVFYRSFFALVPIVAAAFWFGGLHLLKTKRPDAHLIRGFTGIVSMFAGFTALAYIPFADAAAISFAGPLFTVVLASLFLHERVHAVRWAAVVVGFAGILIMIGPHLEFAGVDGERGFTGVILALGGTFCVAFTMVFVRMMSAHEHSITIAFYFSVACAAAGLLSWPFGWLMQSPIETAVLVGTGLLGGVGQLFLSFGYRYAEASLNAPFEYIAMIVAVLMGYFLFDEVPMPIVLVGAAVVIAAGLVIVWWERRTRRRVLPSPLGGEGGELRARSAKE
jgi:drug/metabolite transporter (DMT)-like permease